MSWESLADGLCREFSALNERKDTKQLAEALSVLKTVITRLDLSVLSPISADLEQNIQKVLSAQASSLKDAVKEQRPSEGTEWGIYTAQYFTRLLAILIQNDEVQPKDASLAAYEEVLQPHHNFVLRKIFRGVMCLLPSRETLIKQIDLEINEDLKQRFREFEALSTQVSNDILAMLK